MLRRTARLALPLALPFALLAACGERPRPASPEEPAAPAAATPRADPLVGVWSTDAPADVQGEGLRSRVSDGLTAYDDGNRFASRLRLTIFGPRLPDAGVSFAVSGTGTWSREGDRLTEDYTDVTVTPEREDGELRRLAGQLASELQDNPPAVSTIVSLDPDRLALRSAEGRDATYTRTR